MNQIIWLQRLRISKRINLSFKISRISRIYMLKQLLNNSSLIKNLLPIIIISDGFGCNFHGFAWPWSAIILKSLENVLPLLLPTCQSLNKDNLQFKLLKLHLKLKRRSKLFFRKLKMRQNWRRLKIPWNHLMVLYMINCLIDKIL